MTSTVSTFNFEPLQQQLVDSLKKIEQSQIHTYISLYKQKRLELQKQKQKLKIYLDHTNQQIKTMEISITRLYRDLKISNIDLNTPFYTLQSDNMGYVPGFYKYIIEVYFPNNNTEKFSLENILSSHGYDRKYCLFTPDQKTLFEPFINMYDLQKLNESQKHPEYRFFMYLSHFFVEKHNLPTDPVVTKHENFFENPVNFSISKSLTSQHDAHLNENVD